MTTLLEQMRSILESRGEHYNEKHALIRQPNVFSISTLSQGVGKQIWYKEHDNTFNYSYESAVGQSFVKGRAIHEFVQKRFSENTDWKAEVEVVYDNGNFVLIGHVDLLNLSAKQLVEIKTSKFTVAECENKINVYKLQAGTYAEILKRNFGVFCQPHIFLLNETITEYVMTEEECFNAFKIIETRGYACLADLKKKDRLKNQSSALNIYRVETLAQRISSITKNTSVK